MMQSKAKANQKERGQAAVEFAMLLPIFLIVLFLIVDFGVGISRWVVVTNATREGARLGAVCGDGSDCDPSVDIAKRVATNSSGLLTDGDVNVYYLDGPDSNSDFGDRGDPVVVESEYEYQLITPLRVFVGIAFDSIDFSSCTDMRLELPVSGAANPNGGTGC